MKTVRLSKVVSLFAVIILAVVVFIVLAQPYRISGDCMEPAIKDGGLYFLNRILPYVRQYQVGDIIVFMYEEKPWISRIVALENNIVQINEGSIVVNGVRLQEAAIYRDWANWKYGIYAIEKPIKIPLNHVYVLSDKLSAHHDDSRVFGPITKASILGVIW